MNFENPFEHALSGRDLKDWIWYNIHTSTIFTSMARAMKKYFNLDDEKLYMLKFRDGIPVAEETQERGIDNEVPCDDTLR